MEFRTLNSTGFLFTEVAGAWLMLAANFGDGYQLNKLLGDPAGLRSWSIKIDVLPAEINSGVLNDLDPATFLLKEPGGYLLLESGGHISLEAPRISRAEYLWEFFRMSKAAGNVPFWIEFDDPDDSLRKKFLASFTDHQLSYQVLCARVYATGLQLQQRRQAGVVSPVIVG